MIILTRLYGWYGKRTVNIVLSLILVLIIAGVILQASKEESVAPESTETNVKSVSLIRVGDITSESTFRLIGTVEAVSEAKLQTESSGRVTRVNVRLGDTVGAGAIIAALENSREQAALLQAEGAYESAIAQNAQSEVSLDEAAADAQNLYRDAFTASENTVRNLVDELFSNSDGTVSGFKLDAEGRAPELNDTLREIREMLTEWHINVTDDLTDREPLELLEEAEEHTTEVNGFTVTLAQIVANAEPRDSSFDADELSSYKTRFETARSTLNGILSSISSTRQSYVQATLGASSGVVSASDAQRKSALGTLRAAQANYEKTLVRTPISGTVNALYLKVGEYASQGIPAALIANNGLLEIQTAVGEDEAALLRVGDPVFIDKQATGTIARIAPGVDPLSGKIEVRIAISDAEGLTNGSSVGIAFTASTAEMGDEIVVPIQSLKMLPSGPVVFSIGDDAALRAHTVTLGEVRGSRVVVTEGLTPDMKILADARGMQEGERVEVITE